MAVAVMVATTMSVEGCCVAFAGGVTLAVMVAMAAMAAMAAAVAGGVALAVLLVAPTVSGHPGDGGSMGAREGDRRCPSPEGGLIQSEAVGAVGDGEEHTCACARRAVGAQECSATSDTCLVGAILGHSPAVAAASAVVAVTIDDEMRCRGHQEHCGGPDHRRAGLLERASRGAPPHPVAT